MAKQEHMYAQVLRWVADGEKVQRKTWREDPQWADMSPEGVMRSILSGTDCEFRIKPQTIKIGDREIEAPLWNPVRGQEVHWWSSFSACFDSSTYDPNYHYGLRQAGQLFATKEAAVAAHDAIVALMKGDAKCP